MLKGTSLHDYTNSFSLNDYGKNDKIIIFSVKRWKNYIVLFVRSIENLKNPTYHTSYKKHWLFLLFAVSAKTKIKYYSKKNQLR